MAKVFTQTLLIILAILFIQLDSNAQCFMEENYTVPGTQSFTLPGTITDEYEIELTTMGAEGAPYMLGGNPLWAGGSGAEMKATYIVHGGDVLTVFVGQAGFIGGSPAGGGGGGGTAVIINSSDVLIAASAGGGAGNQDTGGGGLANINSLPQGGMGVGASGGGGFNDAGDDGQGGTGGGAGTLTVIGIGGVGGVVAGYGGNGFGGGAGGAGTGGGGGGGYQGGNGGIANALGGLGGDSFVNTGFSSTLISNTPGVDGGGLLVDPNDGSVTVSCLSHSVVAGIILVLDDIIDVSCFGGNDGQITVSASNGVAPYLYSINGGDFNSSNIFPNLNAGAYTITVMDDAGNTEQLMVTVNESIELLGTVLQVVNNNCTNSEEGIIEVEGSGGMAPNGYLYSLDGGDPQSSGLFSDLPNGFYTVTIIDDLGCSIELYVDIESLSNLSLNTIITTNISCFGLSNGSVTVEGENGSGTYAYSLDNFNYQSSGTFDNLMAGDYTFYVLDFNDCIAEISVSLSQPLLLELMVISVSTGCISGDAGFINVSAEGGTPSYSYSLDNGDVSSTGGFDGLEGGTYIVEVLDENLCVASTTVTLLTGGDMAFDSLSFTNITCFGSNDGTCYVQGVGGVLPYNYVLNGTMNSATGLFENLPADSYVVEIFDDNNCSISSSFTIEDTSEISIEVLEVNNIDCFGMNTGSVSLEISGGTPGYSIVFNGDTSIVNPFTADLLYAGSYPFSVQDANGCIVLDTIDLTENDQVVLSIDSVQEADCLLGLAGSVFLSATGGISPYEFSVNGESSDSGEFNDLLASNYQATVNDAFGCMATADFVISQIGGVQIESVTTTDVTCFGLQDGSITVIPVNTNLIYTYTLDGESNNTGIFGLLGAGDYTITISDDQDCEITIQATIFEPELLTISVTDTLASTGGNDGSITVVAEGGTPAYLYSIDNGDSYQPEAVFEGLINETYTIIVIDTNGCQAEVTQLLSTDRKVLSEDNGIAIFPVPADDILNVNLNNITDQIINYSIYNTSGQKVIFSNESGIHNTLIVNTNDFQEGLYYILIETKENIYSNRFFIAR